MCTLLVRHLAANVQAADRLRQSTAHAATSKPPNRQRPGQLDTRKQEKRTNPISCYLPRLPPSNGFISSAIRPLKRCVWEIVAAIQAQRVLSLTCPCTFMYLRIGGSFAKAFEESSLNAGTML